MNEKVFYPTQGRFYQPLNDSYTGPFRDTGYHPERQPIDYVSNHSLGFSHGRNYDMIKHLHRMQAIKNSAYMGLNL